MCSCNEKINYQAPPTALERFSYWDGQALRSADLNRVLEVAEARRQWHNRALHNAFGVSYGLEPSAVEDAKKNLLTVLVAAGLGYEASGVMLLAQKEQQIPVPFSVPDSTTECLLLLRQPRKGLSDCACSPPARCCLEQTLHSEGWVEFIWKDAASVVAKDGLPLARLLYPEVKKSPRQNSSGRTPFQTGKREPRLDTSF